ncbi:DUF3310 domain-containing protein [Streptomyces sp. Da 82-17]|uniref:DUF3310 domain-containing protein n=1 Tax=Streptomyces sp. Da 82-17 TaxID=3377116 RepID=UPI0038D3DEBA
MAEYKIGDKVQVRTVSGQMATWLYGERIGTVVNVYEGAIYPYEVQFANVGELCFAGDELRLLAPEAPEQNPGRRLLAETAGLAHGIDTQEAQQVMKSAFNYAQKVDLSTPDVVKHPSHYTSHPSGIECIEITKHMNFTLGSAMKYLWRAGLKDDAIQDLEKARQYIDIEIQRLKESSK